MKKSILILIVFIYSFQAKTQESIIPDEVKTYIQSRINNQVNVGIVVGYVDGQNIDYYSYGNTAIANGTPVNKKSVFEIGSISKTFTTTILAIKVINGEMSLDDPISKYLPKTVKVPTKNGKEITLQHLATHTSALPRMPDNMSPKNENNPFADYTYKQLYNFISNHELTRDIGVISEYSNLGMGLLGHILELQSGQTFEELVIQHIANPLKMDDTRLVLTQQMKKRLAKGHAGLSETNNWDIITLGGAGGIRSTTSDMVKYIKANLNSDSGNTALDKAMQLAHQSAFKSEEQHIEMALAWHIENGKFLMHNGATGGYCAMSAIDKVDKKGVIVLTNSNENVDAIAIKLMVPSYPLQPVKPSIAKIMAKKIKDSNIDEAIMFYKDAKVSQADTYNFDIEQLNSLGYQFLEKDQTEIALALFKLNVAQFPEASNPYDSLAEAYLKSGEQTLAITNYKKSLALNPANDNARDVLKSLDVVLEDVFISPEILKTYVGKYQLSPNFFITITTTEGRLFLQATGQSKFEIYPSEVNMFYLKVVEAKVEFKVNAVGEIDQIILFQNGQVLPGQRVE